MAGLGRTMPWPAILMALFMVSLTGIPPTVGFWGKFYLFTAVIQADLTWLAIVAVIMSAVSAYYYLRVVWYMYFREAPEGAEVEAEPAASQAGVVTAVAVAALGVVLVGLFPGPLLDAAQGALRAAHRRLSARRLARGWPRQRAGRAVPLHVAARVPEIEADAVERVPAVPGHDDLVGAARDRSRLSR